jgi:hypothetical protein
MLWLRQSQDRNHRRMIAPRVAGEVARVADEQFSTPIAFEIFNRPEHTRRVFSAIAALRPRELFIMADGPRPGRADDAQRCHETRAVVEKIDWPCQLLRNFSAENMGCRDRTISGLRWVFEHVDEVIFLEDDTLPDRTFFDFCREMLRRFRDDQRVVTVQALNLYPGRASGYSYFFSNLVGGWGRALWRRSWERFDPAMTIWPEVRQSGLLANVFPERSHCRYWQTIMDASYRGRFDSWSYPFLLSCWLQSGLAVVPARNLVRNIGFGADSTHTKVDTGPGKLPLQSLEFPLRHPPFVLADRGYDDRACDWLVRQSRPARRAANRMKRTIGALQARYWHRSAKSAP